MCGIFIFRESDRSLGKPRECWICIFSSPAGFRIWFRSLLKYLLGVHITFIYISYLSKNQCLTWVLMENRAPRRGDPGQVRGYRKGLQQGYLGSGASQRNVSEGCAHSCHPCSKASRVSSRISSGSCRNQRGGDQHLLKSWATQSPLSALSLPL